jgi:hypothetical protein
VVLALSVDNDDSEDREESDEEQVIMAPTPFASCADASMVSMGSSYSSWIHLV